MAQLQFTSVSPPMDSPGVGIMAARLLNFAATMDLVPGLRSAVALDYDVLLDGARKLVTATGAGRTTLVRLLEKGATDPARLRELLADLYTEVEASPAPEVEWGPVHGLLGQALLADLLHVSSSSINRYAGGERPTPDQVADRLHFLALVISELAGAYNPFGIRRWFDRPRQALAGVSPRTRLAGQWSSDSAAASEVRNLASSLNSSPAT